MAPRDDPPQSYDSILLLKPLGILAVVSTLVGRALAPALPGSHSGIAAWINLVEWLNAFLAQLFAFVGLLAAVRLVGSAVRARAHDTLFKLTALPLTLLVGFLVVARMRLDFSEPKSSLALALASSAVALAAAPRLVQAPATRAAGLVLAVSGILGLLHATGRGIALQATLDAAPTRFLLARSIETVGFVVGVVLLALVVAWMFPRTTSAPAKLAGLLIVVGVLSYAAIRGSGQHAGLGEVLASRSVGYLLRDPAPFVPDFIRGGLSLLLLCLSAWLALGSAGSQSRLVFCLCLISAGATDIPLLALALTLAALVARGSGLAQRPSPQSTPTVEADHSHG